jgi:hypothetical protein
VYARAETGYDTPENMPGRVRPGKLARRLILALIIGVLAGAAIILQVKGWTTLGGEAGGACGTSDQGVSYAFGAVDIVVNTTGDSSGQPPVAAIKAPAAQG